MGMKKKYFSEEERKEAIKIKNKKAYEKRKEWFVNYSAENKQTIKEYHKEWHAKTYIKKVKIKLTPEQRKENKRNYQKLRRSTDPLYKLKSNVRTMLSNLISNRDFTKKDKSKDIVGCSFEDLKLYIESKFESWMSWNNYGLYNGNSNHDWDIDHIIPLSSANTEEELLELNHYTNLRPLCSFHNRVTKRARVN